MLYQQIKLLPLEWLQLFFLNWKKIKKPSLEESGGWDFFQKLFYAIQRITKVDEQSTEQQIFHEFAEEHSKAVFCPSHLSFVTLRRFWFVRSVRVAPPTSNKVKINVKLALIFKVSYSIPCFSVCEEIRIISLRISSRLPCQGIC